VAARIRDGIRSGDHQPGERLVERRIAAELGVSHIPVREALTRLEEEGLIVRLPRRGARVAELSPRMLEEVSSLRVVLEQFVVARVQRDWSSSDAHERLQYIVDGMVTAAINGDVDAVHELDQRFHEALWELADHRILLDVAAQMRGRTNHFFRAAAAALGPDELRRHAESHQLLVDVIASGDRVGAERAMKVHIETAASRIAEAANHHELDAPDP
jgi:DNA-binding GntR family transcriptional regulator